MDPPPLPSQPTTTAQSNHPDSATSSPRARPADTAPDVVLVDPLPPVPNPKLRLMCSYGGHIIPRPHDKSLCYVGGDTRMVVVDRHGSSSLSALSSRLSRTLLNGRRFTLKYQLPNEDLDSLISVATDDDLDNMFEEYDRITTSVSSKPGRLRLFLFLAKPDTAASMGSLLDDAKSETWFVDALNGTGFDLPRGLSESAVMDCLVELDDEGDDGDGVVNVDSRAEVDCDSTNNKGKHTNAHNVVAVMPDSPLVETSSSFGSSSSSPSMSNLPPIKVRVEGSGGGALMVGLDDQFLHMNVAPPPSLPTVVGGGVQVVGLAEQFVHKSVAQQLPLPAVIGGGVQVVGLDEQFAHMNAAMPPLPTVIGGAVVSGGGASVVVVSDDERLDQGATTAFRKPPLPLQPMQRKVADACNLLSPDSVASDSSIASATLSKHTVYQEQPHVATSEIRGPAIPTEAKSNIPDPSSQQLHDSAYMLPPQQIQQQQQQFVYTNQHYMHHPVTGQQVPISSYYQMYAPPPSQQQQLHHQGEQQYPMYFYPVTQTMPSNSSTISPSAVYNEPNQSVYMTKTAAPEMTGHVNRNSATATPPPVQVPSNQFQQQYMGVPQMHHHPSQSMAGNYGFEYPHQTHEQVYYAQHPAAAPMPPQYQTMSPATAVFLSQAAAQLPSDTTTQQNRNTQPL
ncbi:uncharacterized protein LOC131310603 isoform X1 [Rhododendron vialii]|uniref:uncharacterized protein LOC131310603 isoform X1 n=1 Tax=Rhododendron vialii TaxID=182163 RepID=UPI00265F4B01|nr:uncharacterized protein LOC131310603 isoform X1 [Rhododendron vialii]